MEYTHQNYGLYDCSCCGKRSKTSKPVEQHALENNVDLDSFCDLYDIDPYEMICKRCFNDMKRDLKVLKPVTQVLDSE